MIEQLLRVFAYQVPGIYHSVLQCKDRLCFLSTVVAQAVLPKLSYISGQNRTTHQLTIEHTRHATITININNRVCRRLLLRCYVFSISYQVIHTRTLDSLFVLRFSRTSMSL